MTVRRCRPRSPSPRHIPICRGYTCHHCDTGSDWVDTRWHIPLRRSHRCSQDIYRTATQWVCNCQRSGTGNAPANMSSHRPDHCCRRVERKWRHNLPRLVRRDSRILRHTPNFRVCTDGHDHVHIQKCLLGRNLGVEELRVYRGCKY